MTSTTAEKRTWTQAELLAEAKRRFGGDPLAIAFTCPACADTATIADFTDEGFPGRAGQECIGRVLGAAGNPDWKGRGCDWTAYGLIPGPWSVEMPDGHKVPSFRLADTERADA